MSEVVLPSQCNLASITELHQQLLGWLDLKEPLEINASAVEQVDLAGLQLICSLYESRTRKGYTTAIARPSAQYRSTAIALALDNHLI